MCVIGVIMIEKLKDFQAKMAELDGRIKGSFMSFLGKHPELFCLSLLTVLCLLFLFVGLDFYPLIDVDETRYAVMAKHLVDTANWNNLMLNYAPFLEKPPLYFWLVAASIKFLGGFSAFAVRLPIAFLATFITFFTYFVGKKAISRKFGMYRDRKSTRLNSSHQITSYAAF